MARSKKHLHHFSDYEITDYGIDHAQYFQGHGVAHTRFEHAALGAGDTYTEALEDALEAAAMEGASLTLDPQDEPEKSEGQGPSASAMFEKACQREGTDPEDCDSELYYYVGLRWNV